MPWWFWLTIALTGYFTCWIIGVLITADWDYTHTSDPVAAKKRAEDSVRAAMWICLIWPLLLVLGGPIGLVIMLHNKLSERIVRKNEKEAIT